MSLFSLILVLAMVFCSILHVSHVTVVAAVLLEGLYVCISATK